MGHNAFTCRRTQEQIAHLASVSMLRTGKTDRNATFQVITHQNRRVNKTSKPPLVSDSLPEWRQNSCLNDYENTSTTWMDIDLRKNKKHKIQGTRHGQTTLQDVKVMTNEHTKLENKPTTTLEPVTFQHDYHLQVLRLSQSTGSVALNQLHSNNYRSVGCYHKEWTAAEQL